MIYKTRKKDVTEGYTNVIGVGYCQLQNLLGYQTPSSFVANDKDGWDADIYDFGTTAIVSGYKSFGNITPPYELCKKYDEQAKKIREEMLDYNALKNEIRKLINQFLDEVLSNSK